MRTFRLMALFGCSKNTAYCSLMLLPLYRYSMSTTLCGQSSIFRLMEQFPLLDNFHPLFRLLFRHTFVGMHNPSLANATSIVLTLFSHLQKFVYDVVNTVLLSKLTHFVDHLTRYCRYFNRFLT